MPRHVTIPTLLNYPSPLTNPVSLRVPGQVLPQIHHIAGPLENVTIRDAVCQVLEGGKRAFLEREKRYSLDRTPDIAETDGTTRR